MIGRNGERRSGISAQAARHDDDDIYIILLIPCLVAKAACLWQKWQYRLELPKLCYHPWMAADKGRVSHLLSHVV